jgi:hypothetical protein
LLATNQQLTPVQILTSVVRRWQMEATFEEARAHLGVETQRQWSEKATARTTPALLALYAMVTMMAAHQIGTNPRPVRTAAWYHKAHATFSDTIALVRQYLWRQCHVSTSQAEADVVKIPRSLFDRFTDLAVQKNIEVDLALITSYDKLLSELELSILQTAKQHDANTLYLLQTVPGIGTILSLVRLYDIHDMARFPRVQDFASYGRLVKCAKASAGKRLGTSGKNIGNAHLTWAFSEAAVLFLRNNEPGQTYLARLENKHDKGKALTILAHKLARAVYDMLKRKTVFDMDIFLHTSGSRAGEPGA